jgi:hypothetical protein
VCSLDIKIVDTREGKVIYEFADVLAEWCLNDVSR